MKTDTIQLHTSDIHDKIADLSAETEKLADLSGLGKKEKMKLILITEELAEAVPQLLNYGPGFFSAENEGSVYTISFVIKPDKPLYNDERKKLVKYSTSGKNALAVGISGKIREAAEKIIADHLEEKEYENSGSSTSVRRNHVLFDDGSAEAWSLSGYRSGSEKGTKSWDELEMSILAKIADEITVGIMSGNVEIKAIITF